MKGFTITELLIIIALLGIITAAVFLGCVLSQKAYKESERAAEITQNSRVILERMNREIRQAREITTELSEDEPEAKVSPSSGIIFEDGHVAAPYHYIHYFEENNVLRREKIVYYFSGDSSVYVSWDAASPEGETFETEILESPKTIGEYLTGLKFWGEEVINISLTLEKGNKKIDLKTKIFGRNF